MAVGDRAYDTSASGQLWTWELRDSRLQTRRPMPLLLACLAQNLQDRVVDCARLGQLDGVWGIRGRPDEATR